MAQVFLVDGMGFEKEDGPEKKQVVDLKPSKNS